MYVVVMYVLNMAGGAQEQGQIQEFLIGGVHTVTQKNTTETFFRLKAK